jgi:hypothetical protein
MDGSSQARGWLWNTFVMVAKARTLLSVAEVLLPQLHRRLTAATPFLGTRREAWAIRQAYESLPRQNFSETVRQAGLPFLAVSARPGEPVDGPQRRPGCDAPMCPRRRREMRSADDR